jgi:hypothetical protein
MGFQVVAVDFTRNRHSPKTEIANIDLSTPEGAKELWTLLQHPGLCFVWMAPPCGTASRAREKPIDERLKQSGWPEPKPLRSNAEPSGISTIEESDPLQWARLLSANFIYALFGDVCTDMSAKAIPWVIENPSNSLMWWMDCMTSLNKIDLVGDTLFHACMHGGSRDKLTRLRSSPHSMIMELESRCDKQHQHRSWASLAPGNFETAEEAAYPDLLCHRIASAVARCFQFVFQIELTPFGRQLAPPL